MQRIAFYRKYRPENFDQTVGQEHIVKVLGNAVVGGKVSHAYLFSGPRGTGKTSIARIMAKALNCTARENANPCGKCDNCKAALEGRILDLIEIDAASNRGIDEIRDLREKVKFSPTEGAYKIFIIDEVHMLTKEAFNALLKTLEEPPLHAIFILATTEINKVPATIISRCQRHDFKRIKITDIVALLTQISKIEGIKPTDEALESIAEASEGGLRDAISLLDQMASLGSTEISAFDVESVLGLAPHKLTFRVVKKLLEADSEAAIKELDKATSSGVDLVLLSKSLSEVLRKIIYLKIAQEEGVEGTKEQIESLKKIAQEYDIERIISISEGLFWAQGAFKTGVDPQIVLTVIFAKLTSTYQGGISVSSRKSKNPEIEPQKRNKNTPEKKINQEMSLNGKWKHFMMDIKSKNNTIHAFLRVASPELSEGVLTLTFPYKFHKERLEESKNKKIVEETLSRIYGEEIFLQCILDGGGHKNSTVNDVESAANILGGKIVD